MKKLFKGVMLRFVVLVTLFFWQETAPAQFVFPNSLTYTPYTFVTFAGAPGKLGTADGTNGTARFYESGGIAIDESNNLYVADQVNNRIRKITADGVVTTIAGAYAGGLRDGTNTDALFFRPSGLVVDSDGNIFVTDFMDNAIREMTPSGTNWITTTIAGNGVKGSADGTNSFARFNEPHDLAIDGAHNIYVADQNNYTIRKITPDGTNWIVTTIAGQAGTAAQLDGTNGGAHFKFPESISMDANGHLFVADMQLIREMVQDGTNWIVTTIAGLGAGPEVDGANNNTTFVNIHGIEVVNNTNIFITDTFAEVVRKMTLQGTNWVSTTLGGTYSTGAFSDGAGSAARFYSPCSVVADSVGNLYIVDYGNDVIRKGFPFAITNQPQGQGAMVGNDVGFGVSLFGDGPFFYQWLFNGMPIPDETNSVLSLASVQRTNNGLYSVVITNTAANDVVTSSNAMLRVLVTPVMQSPEVSSDGVVRLRFQDTDGGVPFDLGHLRMEWCTNLPSPPDTNWQTLSGSFYLTNGVIEFDNTMTIASPDCFYRVVEF